MDSSEGIKESGCVAPNAVAPSRPFSPAGLSLDTWHGACRPQQPAALCRVSELSAPLRAVHSAYRRTVADLPLAGAQLFLSAGPSFLLPACQLSTADVCRAVSDPRPGPWPPSSRGVFDSSVCGHHGRRPRGCAAHAALGVPGSFRTMVRLVHNALFPPRTAPRSLGSTNGPGGEADVSGPSCVISSAIRWLICCPSAQPSGSRSGCRRTPVSRLAAAIAVVCMPRGFVRERRRPSRSSIGSTRCRICAMPWSGSFSAIGGTSTPDKFQGMDPLSVLRIARVSIPYREFALLRRVGNTSAVLTYDSFNPLQGVCPSAAGCPSSAAFSG